MSFITVHKKKDLFKSVLPNDRIILAHGCNAQGVMGSGFAKQFKMLYRKDFLQYYHICKAYKGSAELLGKVIIGQRKENGHVITACCITQQYYGREEGVVYLDYEAYSRAMTDLLIIAKEYNRPVYMPMIGAGLARGDPKILMNTLTKLADTVQVPVHIFLFNPPQK